MAEPPTSIVSGVEYEVQDVDGRAPEAPADFDGELAMSLRYQPSGAVRHELVVRGVGVVADSGIYVNEKDAAGKDVRRWLVVPRDDGGYVAKQGLY